MYPERLNMSTEIRQAHAGAWQTISATGAFFTGEQRAAMVRAARDAQECDLCLQRREALSPNAVHGKHLNQGPLDETIVEVVHRIRMDPGRLTKQWFEEVTQSLGQAAYIEIVSVVASAVIIDTLHNALGLGLAPLHPAQSSTPSHQVNDTVVDGGAWVPILDADQTMADTGLPRVPNIARALGLVPSALDLFFAIFRPLYQLKNINLSISQAQAEFVAARVSAMNECFY